MTTMEEFMKQTFNTSPSEKSAGEEKIFSSLSEKNTDGGEKKSTKEIKGEVEFLLEQLQIAKEKVKKFMLFDDWGDFEFLLLEISNLHADLEFVVGEEEDECKMNQDNRWNELRPTLRSDEATKKSVAQEFQQEQYVVDSNNRYIKRIDRKIKGFQRWAGYLKDYFFRQQQDTKRTT